MTETFQNIVDIDEIDKHSAAEIVGEVKKHPRAVVDSFSGEFDDTDAIEFLKERAELLSILDGKESPNGDDLDKASEENSFLDAVMEKLPQFYEERAYIKQNVINLNDYRTKKIITLQEHGGPVDSIVSVKEKNDSDSHEKWSPEAVVIDMVLRGLVEAGCYRVCKEMGSEDFEVFHVVPTYKKGIKSEKVIPINDPAKIDEIIQMLTRTLGLGVQRKNSDDDRRAQIKAANTDVSLVL
jgi:hypothetical protein